MPADKPAATEQRRGTGSGEAHRETQEQPRLCEHGYNWNTCSLCYRPTPPHLLTALQKVEADRNRYIQRAGTAEGRLEVMEADLQALREENARLKGALAHEQERHGCTAAAARCYNMMEAKLLDVLAAIRRELGQNGESFAPFVDPLNDVKRLKRVADDLSDKLAALSPSPAQEQRK